MKFNDIQQQKIIRLFKNLNDSEVQYVVPRGDQDLPNQTPGGDIDLIVKDEDFKIATKIAKEQNYRPRTTKKLNSIWNLGKKAIKKPQTAVCQTYNSPIDTVKLIFEKSSNNVNKKGRGSISDWRAYNGDIMIHFRNHLAYKSPLRGGLYRIDPAVEKQLFKYRRRSEHIYIPSPPDKMAHLICRGVFDRRGDFPDYYIKECDHLIENMENSEIERFKNLLSHIFFEADEFVYALICDRKYNSILQSLRNYSDY